MMYLRTSKTAHLIQLSAVAAFVFSQGPLLVGQQATVQIVSPAAGTVVAPGDLINVAVTVGQEITTTGVFVIAQNLGLSPTRSTGPFHFSFVAPGGGFVGPLSLTAVAILGSGSPVFSQPIVISVEKAVALSSLSVSPPRLGLAFSGQQVPLIVTGTFVDGSTFDVTGSTQTRYVSNDLTVAQVGAAGVVTATGVGTTSSTQIVVSYGALSKAVVVNMPKALRGDLNGDGQVDQDDLNILLAFLNTPAAKPADGRDLNGDGVINALDSRILVTLCTRLGCATH